MLVFISFLIDQYSFAHSTHNHSFQEFKFLKVFLYLSFDVRLGSQTGGIILQLLYPKLKVFVIGLQCASQSSKVTRCRYLLRVKLCVQQFVKTHDLVYLNHYNYI